MPPVTKQSPRSIPIKSKPVAVEYDPWGLSDTLRVLVYGQSGSGKTTFAATFPDPILWLLCSGGNRPSELKSVDTPRNRQRIRPRVVETMSGFANLITDAENVATVVLDHASGLADLILREILGLEKLPEQKGWGMATQQQYGQLGMQCKEALRALLNLPCNVVILAQERTFGGKDDGPGADDAVKPTVGASLTPSITGWLNPACDYVVNTFKMPKFKETPDGPGKPPKLVKTKGVNYCLRVGPHDTYMTKFRMPVDEGHALPEYIVLYPAEEGYNMMRALIKGRDSMEG